jgi:hypothetical protein
VMPGGGGRMWRHSNTWVVVLSMQNNAFAPSFNRRNCRAIAETVCIAREDRS